MLGRRSRSSQPQVPEGGREAEGRRGPPSSSSEEGKVPKLSSRRSRSDKEDEAHGEGRRTLTRSDADPGQLDEDLDDQLDAEAQDEVKEDFEVLFARDFVLKEPFVQRDRMLQAGKGYLDEARAQEEERINTAIAALGVDWSPGPTPKTPQLVATLRPGPDKRLAAGDTFDLEVTVENKGSEPLSADPRLDRERGPATRPPRVRLRDAEAGREAHLEGAGEGCRRTCTAVATT